MMSSAIFDLDGTLLDSAPLCAEIMTTMRHARGSRQAVSHADARRYASLGGQTLVASLLAELAGDPHRDLAEFRQLYASMPTPANSLFPGVREGLVRLHALGIVLSVFSNKPQVLCEKVVADLDLAPLFRRVVGSRAGVPVKPDPTGLEILLRDLGVSRSRACYVGDSALDHIVARAAGLPFILVAHGYAEPDHGFSDARVASTFDDVVSIIETSFAAPSVSGADI